MKEPEVQSERHCKTCKSFWYIIGLPYRCNRSGKETQPDDNCNEYELDEQRMKREARLTEIIDYLDENKKHWSSHYYQTPEGIISLRWGLSNYWEHEWIDLECWPPAEEPTDNSLPPCCDCPKAEEDCGNERLTCEEHRPPAQELEAFECGRCGKKYDAENSGIARCPECNHPFEVE